MTAARKSGRQQSNPRTADRSPPVERNECGMARGLLRLPVLLLPRHDELNVDRAHRNERFSTDGSIATMYRQQQQLRDGDSHADTQTRTAQASEVNDRPMRKRGGRK